MALLRTMPRTARIAIGVILAFASASLIAVGVVGAVVATDQPGFCLSCHEMGPYHEAWASGPHSGVSCVKCHVGATPADRLTHKFVALKEVRDHFLSDPTFPLLEPAEVPNERCIACHQNVPDTASGFSHAVHDERRDCQSCHPETGHEVTIEALGAAGILNAQTVQSRLLVRTAVAGKGAANLIGHKRVSCDRCHNMKATPCSTCHHAPHRTRGACSTCHRPGARFVFTHPASKKCSTCHKPPTRHSKLACTSCHRAARSWAFYHPSAAVTCAACHKAPSSHSSLGCATCHKTGVSWAFQHPASANCESCHRAPTGHRSGTCASCHQAGSRWAFYHPGSSADCSSCHARPAGHSTGQCSTCHSAGTTWTAAHPSSSACASCHSAPAGHYSSTCASCHSPSRAWSSATFSHPSIPGGEHSSRSFACTTCHPNGYASASCSHCHNNSGGPRDDD